MERVVVELEPRREKAAMKAILAALETLELPAGVSVVTY